jgi:hypothetical protein
VGFAICSASPNTEDKHRVWDRIKKLRNAVDADRPIYEEEILKKASRNKKDRAKAAFDKEKVEHTAAVKEYEERTGRSYKVVLSALALHCPLSWRSL